jgi:hypothetical protein
MPIYTQVEHVIEEFGCKHKHVFQENYNAVLLGVLVGQIKLHNFKEHKIQFNYVVTAFWQLAAIS